MRAKNIIRSMLTQLAPSAIDQASSIKIDRDKTQ